MLRHSPAELVDTFGIDPIPYCSRRRPIPGAEETHIMRNHSLSRVYSIEPGTSQTVLLVRRDGSVSRRIYRGEFGGLAWHQVRRREAAALLRMARRDPDTAIYRSFRSGR